MKVTKYTLLWIGLTLAALSCTDDDLNNQQPGDLTPHVRFNLLVGSNNTPLEYPQKSASLVPVAEYTHQAIKTLKVPVTLSARDLKEDVSVQYGVNTELPEGAVTISPAELHFTPQQPTDTLYLSFPQRWETGATVDLLLTGTSNPEIQLGSLNNSFPGDQLRIALGEISTSIALSTSRIELEGQIGETAEFKVTFPDGYFASEINDQELFSFLNGFDYTLERISQEPAAITYRITLSENIALDDVYYQSEISLKETALYKLGGISRLLLVKPVRTDRDVMTNPAAHFYNLADPYYRTYGENWLDHDADGICDWRAFNAFTYPVVVDASHPNAVLYSDNGTPDPSDDVYHDAFRIGFNSPLANRTTNSFNLTRWFNGEATTADKSPGLNIPAAIEFFPTSGTSQTEGIVQVIPQYLVISNLAGKSYELAISGSGTYRALENGLYEIKVTLKVTNDELFGGTVSSEYYIYNANTYTDPEPLSTGCVTNMDI